MRTMEWYNPKTRAQEEVPAPMSEAQAIEMLSGHQRSGRFIEEYRRLRGLHSDIVVALTLTGETFYWEHRKRQPPH
jgi:hypothetical protein